jgi:uncharacterized FlaG/YvyC family protein
MNHSSIQPIGSTQQVENSAATQLTTAQLETLNQARLTASRTATPQAEAKAKPEVKISNSLENISIHFRVDEETNNVTIFLVDRKSHKVLRSIPAAELQKMQIGDLLKLTA